VHHVPTAEKVNVIPETPESVLENVSENEEFRTPDVFKRAESAANNLQKVQQITYPRNLKENTKQLTQNLCSGEIKKNKKFIRTSIFQNYLKHKFHRVYGRCTPCYEV